MPLIEFKSSSRFLKDDAGISARVILEPVEEATPAMTTFGVFPRMELVEQTVEVSLPSPIAVETTTNKPREAIGVIRTIFGSLRTRD